MYLERNTDCRKSVRQTPPGQAAVARQDILWRRLVVIGLLVTWFGCAGTGLRSELVFSGDLESHKTELDALLAQQPGDAELHLRLGALEYQRKQYPSARRHLQQTLAIKANNAEAIHLLGLVALAEGNPREAVQHLITATELDERIARIAHQDLEQALILAIQASVDGSSHAEAGDLAERLEKMGTPLTDEQRKWMSRAFVAQANVHFAGGYYAECQTALDRAARYSAVPEIHYQRGRLYASVGRGEDSKAEFATFVETLSKDQRAVAYERIGEFYEENFRFDEAVEFYARALNLPNFQPDTRWKLGAAYLKLKRSNDAMETFRSHINSAPIADQLNLVIDASRLFVKFQFPDHAREILRWAIQQFPAAIAPVHTLARLEQGADRKDEAVAVYSAYLSRNQGPAAAQEVAVALQDVGLFSDAISVLQQQREVGGLNNDLIVTIGHLYHLNGNAQERDRVFGEYIATAVDKADAEAVIGLQYASYRLVPQAQKHLLNAHNVQPGREDVALTLADLFSEAGDKANESRALKQFITNASEPRSAQLAVGSRYLRAGAPEAAAPYLIEASQGNDEVAATAHHELGKLALRTKPPDYSIAEAAFKDYLRLTSNKEAALNEIIGRIASHQAMSGFLAEVYEELVTFSPQDTARLLQLAQAYLSSKRFERATQTLARYVEASTDRLVAVKAAIDLCLQAGREEDALKLVELLGLFDLNDPLLSKEIGDLYSKATRYRDLRLARSYYERYLSSGAGDTRDMRSFGDQLFDLQLFDLALTAYRRAMTRSGETEKVALRLAECHLQLRQPKEAESLLRTYMDTKPNRWQGMDEVGQLWIKHGYLSQAATVYREAFESNVGKQMESALHRLFDLYMALDQKEKLSSLGRVYLEQQNNRRNAQRKLAALYSNVGMRSEALAVRAKMREGGSTLGDALFAYERDLFRLGEDQRAVELVKETVAEAGLKPPVVIEGCRLLQNEGFGEDALTLFDRALTRHSTDGDLLVGRAGLRLQKGDVDGAHTDFFTALVHSRNPSSILDFAGEKYGEFGQSNKMLDLVQRAVQSNPQRPEHYLRLVRIYLQSGDTVSADQAAVNFLQKNEFGASDLAPIYAAAGHYDQAIRYYGAAIERANFSDESGNLIGRLVELLLSSGRADELDQALSRYRLNADPTTPADLNIFEACFSAGRFQEAAAAWQRSGADLRSISKADDVLTLARLMFAVGREAEALQFIEHVRERQDGKGGIESEDEPLVKACKVLVGANKRALALRWLDQAVDLGTISGSALGYALSLHLNNSDDVLALERFRVAVSGGWAAHRGSLDDVAAVLLLHGLERETVAILEQSPRAGKDPETAVLLLRLYVRLGNSQKAKELEARLLAQSPSIDSGIGLAIAVAYINELKLEQAVRLARQVVMTGSPDFWRKGFRLLCRALVMAGKDNEVSDVFKDLGNVIEDKQQLFSAQVEIAVDLGLWELADEAASALARLLPDQVEPVEKLLQIRMMNGDDVGLWRAVDDYVARSANGPEPALLHLTQHFARNLRPDLAQEAADRLVRRDPKNAWFTVSAAQYAMESLQLDRVKEYLARYRELRDDKVRVAIDSARLFLFGGYEAEAKEAIQDAVTHGSQRWETWYTLGQLYLLEGDTAKAGDAFRKAASVASQPAQVLTIASELVISNPEMPIGLAESLASEARSLRPRIPGAVAVDTVAKMAAGDLVNVEVNVQNIDDIGYERTKYLGWIAERAMLGGHVPVFDQVMRSVFESAGVQGGRGAALDTAIGIVRRAVSPESVKGNATDSPEFRTRALSWLNELDLDPALAGWTATWRSDILESMGDAAGAQQVYRRMIQLFPADSSAYNNLSYLFARRNEKLEEARELVRRARLLDPSNDVFYLDTEGWVEYRLGNFPRAIELIQRSIRLMSANLGSSVSESYWHLGKTYEAMGNTEKALLNFRRAAMLDPSGAYGQLARDDVRRLLGKKSVSAHNDAQSTLSHPIKLQ